ncbi:MAG: response regulator transcription factor [Verrucomicrobia bacterium]|nr:response regulator transcription factor [Verrucomicrobiota bacterium]
MSTRSLTRLLLVDDHPVVRDGLRCVEQIEPLLRVVGEAETMAGALEAARRLRPEVILMDVRLPDGDGMEACRHIKAWLPEVRVLFLTSYADNRFVLAAMEAGADGYLLKESDAQRIVEAIRCILNGGTVFDPVVTRGVMNGLKTGGGANPLSALSAQERRVLEEVTKGRTDKEVAGALGLTTKTARNYLDRVFSKLDVHTRTEAAMLYIRFSRGAGPE